MKRLLVAFLLAVLAGATATAQGYPDASGDHHRAVPGRRRDRRADALSRRAHAARARSADRDRERRGRRRDHRRRPRGARAGRRLHHPDRHLDHQSADRRPLSAAVRSARRPRADHHDRQRADDGRRQESAAAGKPQGADRPGSRPIRTRPRSAFPASAAPAISPGSPSRRRPAPRSSSCPIAATDRRCRTSSQARSICRWSPPRTSTRRSRPEPSRPMR